MLNNDVPSHNNCCCVLLAAMNDLTYLKGRARSKEAYETAAGKHIGQVMNVIRMILRSIGVSTILRYSTYNLANTPRPFSPPPGLPTSKSMFLHTYKSLDMSYGASQCDGAVAFGCHSIRTLEVPSITLTSVMCG